MEPRGASVVIVGGGVTGLSAGWWLARSGVDVLVLEAGIVGWEASGRNGGGATHVYSPLGVEEQRLWPQMDTLLGYPTEHAPHRIKVALSDEQLTLYQTNAEIAARQGFRTEPLDRKQLRELVPIVGDNAIGGLYLHFGGHANPQRKVRSSRRRSARQSQREQHVAKGLAGRGAEVGRASSEIGRHALECRLNRHTMKGSQT